VIDPPLDGLIDLHSHLLPGVDDGSKTSTQSRQVLEQMARDGISAICLTPHLRLSQLRVPILDERLASHSAAAKELAEVAPSKPVLYRGVELMIDRPFDVDTVVDRRITLNRSRYLLVEFPTQFTSETIRGLLRMVVQRDLVPLIAHAERYAACSPQAVFEWREEGAAIQVDATTVARDRRGRGERARSLLRAGLVDVIAADNHGDDRSLATAARHLESSRCSLQAEYLLQINPKAVVEDLALESVPPMDWTPAYTRLIRLVRRHLGGGR
jgi:protein-tyrosine phosphatase